MAAIGLREISVLAVSSIYGVVMRDNAGECHDCLFDVWLSMYKADLRKEPGAERSVALRFILAKNILCDDALTMLRAGVGPMSGISSGA